MEAITIVLLAILGISNTYALFYAQQKGKNLADKEDLKKLTEIVEEVKRKNIQEIELLKSNLSLSIDRQKRIFGDEKYAIITFFAQLNTWIWDGLNIYIHEYNHSNYQDISARLIAMRDAYNQTNIAFSKVRLIVNDEDLILNGNEAIIKTLKLHHFVEGILKKLSLNLSWEKILISKILDKEINFEELSTENKQLFHDLGDQYEKKKEELKEEYYANFKGFYEPAMDEIRNFKNKAKVYLRQSN